MKQTAFAKAARVLGVAMIGIGAVGATLGMGSPAFAATQVVPMSNEDADVLEACPDSVGDYWHLVITPNNGTFEFVSITLNLDGDSHTFTGAQIIINGTQKDNVFVEVPAPYTLASLVKAGSSAEISPETGSPKFVLSHLCDGSDTPTTPPTEPPPSSDESTTTSDATTSSDVTSSSDSSVPASSDEPTTSAETTTTVGGALVAGPPPPSEIVTTSLFIDPLTELPETGKSSASVVWVALLALGFGATAIGFARRPARNRS